MSDSPSAALHHMARFIYSALSRTGEKASGSLIASSKAAAIQRLERMRLFPVSIEQVHERENVEGSAGSHSTAVPLIPATRSMHQPSGQPTVYGGVRRLGFFFGLVGVGILDMGFEALARGQLSVVILGWLATMALSLLLIVKRLNNTGLSGWWALLMFIPVANVILGIRCLMMPEGYQDSKRLDTAAQIILCVIVVCLVSIVTICACLLMG